jgi:hypothetical protein
MRPLAHSISHHCHDCNVFIRVGVCLDQADHDRAAALQTAEATVRTAYKNFQLQFNKTKQLHTASDPMSTEMLQRQKAEILADSTGSLLQKEKVFTDAKRARAELETQLADANLTGPCYIPNTISARLSFLLHKTKSLIGLYSGDEVQAIRLRLKAVSLVPELQAYQTQYNITKETYELHKTPIPVAMWPAQKAPHVHVPLAGPPTATPTAHKQSYRAVVNQIEVIALEEQVGNEIRVDVTLAHTTEQAALRSKEALLARRQQQADSGTCDNVMVPCTLVSLF